MEYSDNLHIFHLLSLQAPIHELFLLEFPGEDPTPNHWCQHKVCLQLMRILDQRGLHKGYGAAISETLTWGGGGVWGAVNWIFSYSIFMGKLLQNNISWNKFSFFWDFPCSLASVTVMLCNLFEFKPFWAMTLRDIVWQIVDLWFRVSSFLLVMRIWWLGAVK